MKNYYYCEANMAIYTENEKINSVWPANRFRLVGAFRSRPEAEKAYDDSHAYECIRISKHR